MWYRNKSLCIFAGLSLLVVPSAFAGQVYGTIYGVNGLVKNAKVIVVCNTQKGEQITDEYGTYSVYVNGKGKCQISVNNSEPLDVRVYDDEVRYDLRLSKKALKLK